MFIQIQRIGLSLLFVTLVFCFAGPTPAASYDELAGEAFSDPDVTQDMDANWQEKSIKYDVPDKDADLVVSLNQQFYEFMLPYVNEYADERGLNIVVKRGTCGLSAGMLSKKKGDIGAFCCPPGKSDRLPGLQFHTVGIHSIAILVNPINPIDNILLRQLREVFKGNIVDWAELGWDNGRIHSITRLHCKKRPGHWRLILDNEDMFGTGVREVGAIEDMFTLVAAQPTAIGYEVLWLTNRQEGKVKALKINNHGPDDLEKLLSGQYPFYRSLILTTWEPAHLKKTISQNLVDYIIKQVDLHGEPQGIVSARRLRSYGWKFSGNELVGTPEENKSK